MICLSTFPAGLSQGDDRMPKYLLAHDLGTSGNKATLFTTRVN